jgi:FkbM family methyltransferase
MNAVKSALVKLLDTVLPSQLKRSIFHLSFHLARAEFNRFAYEISHSPDMELGLRATADRGLIPKTIIDVGAFEGSWSKLARAIWPSSRIYMFEPNRSKRAALEQVALEIGGVAYYELLGAQDDAPVTFNVMETGSSIFGELSPLQRSPEERHLRRLDSTLQMIDGPALLKIDTQGYELEVLKGATALLDKIDAILLEVALIEINKGAPLLHEVLPFMAAIGFVAYDIVEIHRRPLDRATNQIDLLFIRPRSQLLHDKSHF